jgi:hypothetical protein
MDAAVPDGKVMTRVTQAKRTKQHMRGERSLFSTSSQTSRMEQSKAASNLQLTLCIHYAPDVRADSNLAASLTAFINDGYRYMSPANKERWNRGRDERLASPESIHQALGEDGLIAAVYNAEAQEPVACAATKRWLHDLEGFSEEGEEGWEIKMVTTNIDWMKRGLAGQCVDALIDDLARQESVRRGKDTATSQGPLNIWIQAVECLNGAFWLKKGGRLMRSYDKPIGHWGSKYGYRLLVLLREIDIGERLSRLSGVGA